jgi:hypothetical protein
MSGVGKFVDEKFNGKHFGTWKRQAKDFLVIKHLAKYVTGKEEAIKLLKTKTNYADKAEEALAYQWTTISSTVLKDYFYVEEPHILWQKIHTCYQTNTHKRVSLQINHLIGDLSETIGFGMKCGGQTDIHPKHFKQSSAKFGGELGAVI